MRRSRRPSPAVTLNRAVAVSKAQGPPAALAMIEPLAGYFHFFGLTGALLPQLDRVVRDNSPARVFGAHAGSRPSQSSRPSAASKDANAAQGGPARHDIITQR